MKLRVVWLGLAVFVLVLLIVLPVRWIAGMLPPQLQCGAWSGSVWSGQCAALTLQQGGAPLQVEMLRWKLRPAALLRLSMQADFDVRTAQGVGHGRVELGRKGRLDLQDVAVNAVFDQRLYTGLPSGWNGQLDVQHLALRVQGKQLQALSGELTLRDFNDGRGGALGSYRLVFPPAAAPPFIGNLQDTGGPLAVTASLTVSAERRWLLDGLVATRTGAPDVMQRRLDMLGPPDASGRRSISIEGSFN